MLKALTRHLPGWLLPRSHSPTPDVAPSEVAPATPDALPALFRSIGLDRDYSALDLEGLHPAFDPLGEVDEATFDEVVRTVRPSVVIEVGTWTGASLLRMHHLSKRYGCKTRFIAVDTWLGSNDALWFDDSERARLLLVGGYPTMFRQFVANILAHGVSDDVFPLPMTSTAAAHVLRRLGVAADVIYIDAGHEEEEVAADIKLYYELLRPGGILFGDDYHTRWPGVIRAVNAFAAVRGLDMTRSGEKHSKWLIRKPSSPLQ